MIYSELLASAENAGLIPMGDGSVALIGQRGSPIVEHVRLDGNRLIVHKTANLPGPQRFSTAGLGLRDGRIFIVGGNTGAYRGCGPCIRETYIYDPHTQSWSNGGYSDRS